MKQTVLVFLPIVIQSLPKKCTWSCISFEPPPYRGAIRLGVLLDMTLSPYLQKLQSYEKLRDTAKYTADLCGVSARCGEFSCFGTLLILNTTLKTVASFCCITSSG